MKVIKTLILVCFHIIHLHSQDNNGWAGDWAGILTQNSGGYKATYNVRLTLKKSSNEITGFFYVDEKGLTSKMSVKAELISKNRLKIVDIKILEHHEPDNVDWCYKTYLLEYKITKGKKVMEGSWTGKSKNDACIPGKVFLKQALPRA